MKRQILLNTYLNQSTTPYFKNLTLSQLEDLKNDLHAGSIPETLTREKVIELVKTYGPIIYIHGQATIFPFNIEENWDKYNYEKRGSDNYMTEKDSISSASGTLPWYFKSKDTLKDVKTYVFVRSLPNDEFGLYFVNFWPFNRGKNIKLISTSFGNHSMDLTSCAVIFNKDFKPVKNFVQTHSHRRTWLWRKHEGKGGMQEVFDRRNIYQEYQDDHSIYLSSIRGNELYPSAGFTRYTYVDKPLLKLRDYVDRNGGIRYETFNKFLIIMPENLYNISNIAYDNEGKSYDLSIPNVPEIKNWPAQLNFLGRDKQGRVHIKGIVDQYIRTGHVHLKNSEYLREDRKNGQDEEMKKYISLKNTT